MAVAARSFLARCRLGPFGLSALRARTIFRARTVELFALGARAFVAACRCGAMAVTARTFVARGVWPWTFVASLRLAAFEFTSLELTGFAETLFFLEVGTTLGVRSLGDHAIAVFANFLAAGLAVTVAARAAVAGPVFGRTIVFGTRFNRPRLGGSPF